NESGAATIELRDTGYTMSITVTAEQARKVKSGDTAEVQYFWGGEANVVLQSITADEKNPSKSKILRFSVTGDITPGQTLQISMGSKGQRYDYIVPNSSIREDNNGKFVLAVTAKSSPLGNRYVAERVAVEVLASDDTSSAVSGGFTGGEMIISTSSKPIEAGMQVRYAEN
ncbi:MAG: RND transporter, partial [Oscillospiraceae bacterium]|nr:RND transporter [Oscillospiraceae bacterium]